MFVFQSKFYFFSINCCFCEYFVKNLTHVFKFKFVVIVFLNKNIAQPKWINADRKLENRIVKHKNNFEKVLKKKQLKREKRLLFAVEVCWKFQGN